MVFVETKRCQRDRGRPSEAYSSTPQRADAASERGTRDSAKNTALLRVSLRGCSAQAARGDLARELLFEKARKLREVARLGHEPDGSAVGAQELSCKTLSAVKAEVLKGADVPPNDLATAMAAPSDYERWTATLCGQPVAFLLGVWPADGKQSPFRIVYPFAP